MADLLGLCAREPKHKRSEYYEKSGDHFYGQDFPDFVEDEGHGHGLFSNWGELFGSSQKKSIKLDGDTWIVSAQDVKENIYLHDVEPHHNLMLTQCSGGCSVVANSAINQLLVNDSKDFRTVVLGAREVSIKDSQDLTVDFRGLYVPTTLKFTNSSRCVLNLPQGVDPNAVETTVEAKHSTAMFYRTSDGEKIALTPSTSTVVVKGGEAHVISAEGDKMAIDTKPDADLPPHAIDQSPEKELNEELPQPAEDQTEPTDPTEALNNVVQSAAESIQNPSVPNPNVPGAGSDPSATPGPTPSLPGRPGLVPADGWSKGDGAKGTPAQGDIAGRFTYADQPFRQDTLPVDPTPDTHADVPWYNRNLSPLDVPPPATDPVPPGGTLPRPWGGGAPGGGTVTQPQGGSTAPSVPAGGQLSLDTDVDRRQGGGQGTRRRSEAADHTTEVPLSPETPGTPAVDPLIPRTPSFNRTQTFNNVGTPLGKDPLAPEEFQG